VVTFSEAELATRTTLLLPLKLSALPKRPWVDHVAPVSVPTLPLPEASAVVAPDPSPNPQAAARPEFGGGGGGGGAAPLSVTILATDGTPLASTMNSM
jgi:hypothetical protein